MTAPVGAKVIDATKQTQGAQATPLLAPAPWPADLDAAVDAFAARVEGEIKAALAQPDADATRVRGPARLAAERAVAPFADRAAAIENRAAPPGPTGAERLELDFGRLRGAEVEQHPAHAEYLALQARIEERGTLTPAGRDQQLQALAAERAAAVEAVTAPLRTRLDGAARFWAERAAAVPRADEADLRVAATVAEQLRVLTPAHGLPLVAHELRAAARAGAVGVVRALRPVLQSMYERAGTEYAANGDLLALINQAGRLLVDRDARVAAARRDEVARTRWELDEFARRMATGTGLTGATRRDGSPVLLG